MKPTGCKSAMSCLLMLAMTGCSATTPPETSMPTDESFLAGTQLLRADAGDLLITFDETGAPVEIRPAQGDNAAGKNASGEAVVNGDQVSVNLQTEDGVLEFNGVISTNTDEENVEDIDVIGFVDANLMLGQNAYVVNRNSATLVVR